MRARYVSALKTTGWHCDRQDSKCLILLKLITLKQDAGMKDGYVRYGAHCSEFGSGSLDLANRNCRNDRLYGFLISRGGLFGMLSNAFDR